MHQAEVAERVGISIEVYGRFERGSVTPRLSTLLRMCEVLHLQPNDLLLGSDPPRDRAAAPLSAGMARLFAVLERADDVTIQRVTEVARWLLSSGTAATWTSAAARRDRSTTAMVANESKAARAWNAPRRAPSRRSRG